MVLSDISIKRPVFTTMVIVALMSLGLLSLRNIGVDQFPDVSFPVVLVTTVYPGAGPVEVEEQVSKPIEEALSSVNLIDTVRSFSRESVSQVVVQFKLEADVKAAATDVREKMALIRSKLPKDVREPMIARFDPTALPILNYVLSSERHPAETRRIAEDVVKPALEAIDGVAAVTVNGGLEREVKVWVNRTKLDALGIGLAQVAQQLGAEGFDLPAGRMATERTELNVKTEGRFRSLEELESVVVASMVDGSQVRLRDVARVVDDFKEVRNTSRLDGKDAVTLEIQKQGGTNTVQIADKAYAAVAKLQAVLPADVKLLKAVDSSTNIRRSVTDVSHDIVLGGLAAVFIIFLFMLDWRSTFISSLSLPTSVVTTFLVIWWMGFTFNMMSLLALSLSIGLLIDDAVVVRENIFRHMEMGKDPITASREGTAEIGLAVMATTFTIVAVFVPVGFMGGMVGKFFKQFGLTVAAAVLVSLFVSFTLDPMMSARVMKPIEPGHHAKLKHHRYFGPIVRFYDAMDVYYRGILAWALDHKKLVVAGAAALFVGSLYLTNFMGKEFVSPADRGEFRVKLEAPSGVSFAEMLRITERAEAEVRKASPHVKSLFTNVGVNGEPNKAAIRVYTTPALERPGVTQWDIQAAIREQLSHQPGLRYAVSDLGMIEGGEEAPVMVFVRGSDYGALHAYATAIVDALKSTRGAVDAEMSFRTGKAESAVRIDRQAAADQGVSMGVVAQTLRLALEGDTVAKYRHGDKDIDVRIQLPPEDREDASTLLDLRVPATGRRIGTVPGANPLAALMSQGRLVRVGDVADVSSTTGPVTIEREARQRQIIVTANLQDRALGDVVADMQAKLKAVPLPPGVTTKMGGMAERMQETFENMGLAMAIAILFIFFVLASQFESFIHPFTIMIALPLAIVGALLLLFLTGFSIGMSSMIGIILLMGLVTKNSILLVDYTNELRERGMRMKDALLEAGPTRLRPILMTSAAMVLGMVPGAMSKGEGSEFKGPMAVAVIGGVIASTLLTLVVVPIVYTWFDRFTTRGAREHAEDVARERAARTHDTPKPAEAPPDALPVPALRLKPDPTA